MRLGGVGSWRHEGPATASICVWEGPQVNRLFAGCRIRPVGTALSPNGIAMCEEGMVSLTHVDKILKVDKDKMTVTVEAGARVSQVRQPHSAETDKPEGENGLTCLLHSTACRVLVEYWLVRDVHVVYGRVADALAGVWVQVLEALSKHGLTLQNFSSIQEQQMGGWTQVHIHLL